MVQKRYLGQDQLGATFAIATDLGRSNRSSSTESPFHPFTGSALHFAISSTSYLAPSARPILDARDLKVHQTIVDNIVTCQEMAGVSFSIAKLDAELKKL